MNLSLKTALLVIDMQNDSMPDGFYPVWNMPELVGNVRRVIEACRSASIPIIYTQQTYRADGVDCALAEPRDAQGRPLAYLKGSDGWRIPAELEPADSDVVVEKQRWTAFYGTNLEVVLRGLGVQQLIITGVVTDGCVQTTVYDAFFRDYPVVLVKDGCSAYNQGCHEAAMLNMANWVYGLTIIATDQLVAALAGRPYQAWTSAEPNSKAFTAENLHELYLSL